MPKYSYVCTECGHRFDAQQSFADTALTECPVCEGRLRKLFGNVGVVFKGPGFYRTDARAGAGHGAKKGGRRSSGDSSSPATTPAAAAAASAPAASPSGAGSSGSGSGSADAAAASA